MRVILRNDEFAPLADMAVVDVAPLTKDYTVLQRIVPSQFGGLFEVGRSRVKLSVADRRAIAADVPAQDHGNSYYGL